MSYKDALRHGSTNVGLGMVPHKKGCYCGECTVDRHIETIRTLKARIAELEYALELVASGELMYPEQTARQALQEQEK